MSRTGLISSNLLVYKKIFLTSILFLWVCLITIFSLLPDQKLSIGFLWFQQADKLVHFIFYFGFAFLLLRLLYHSSVKLGRSFLIVAVVIPTVYSGIIELAQEYLVVSRNAELLDFFVNMLGAIAAVVLGRYFLKLEFSRFYTKEFS